MEISYQNVNIILMLGKKKIKFSIIMKTCFESLLNTVIIIVKELNINVNHFRNYKHFKINLS